MTLPILVRDEALTPKDWERLQRQRERDRQRYRNNPKRRARVIATVKEWQAKNAERFRAYKRTYRRTRRARAMTDAQLETAIELTRTRLDVLLAESAQRRAA